MRGVTGRLVIKNGIDRVGGREIRRGNKGASERASERAIERASERSSERASERSIEPVRDSLK